MKTFNCILTILGISFILVGCNQGSSSSNISTTTNNGQLSLTASCDRNSITSCSTQSNAVFVTVNNNGLPPSTPITITIGSNNQNIIYTDVSESSCIISRIVPRCVFEYFGPESGAVIITATSSNSNFLESTTSLTVQ